MASPIPSVLEPTGDSMYVSERKVYPRDVDGRFQRLRTAAVVWLLGMYYLFPWFNWDGRQAVLFDLPARKFYVFGLSFWPQDFIYLALLLILAGLALFFFTALAGRLWCGYACPQTVWTEVFLWMERWTEGDRLQRIKLDAAPMSAAKLRRKFAKHMLWLLFALWTGFTFVGFFTPIRDLGARLFLLDWGGWEWFWVLFYSLATWGNAGVLREQVCKYMCPYARFQSAMFDRNTLIISYDAKRGEQRGPRRTSQVGSVVVRGRDSESRDPGLGTRDSESRDPGVASSVHCTSREVSRFAPPVISSDSAESLPTLPGSRVPDPGSRHPESRLSESRVPSPGSRLSESRLLGDCLDCTLCVQVCPTGIDIRNGLQYECIACGACIDACDQVMDKVGYPRGLIRYTTQNAVDGQPTRIVRPRVAIYALLLLLIAGAWVWGVATRSPLIVDVLRDRNALYRETAEGRIENAYTLKLVNKLPSIQHVELRLRTPSQIQLIGMEGRLEVAAEAVLNQPLTLQCERERCRGRLDVELELRSLDHPDLVIVHTTRFFAP